MEPDKLSFPQRALLPVFEYMEEDERIRADRELWAAVKRLLEWTRGARG